MKLRKRDQLALTAAALAVVLYAIFQLALFPIWDDAQEMRANLSIQEKKLEKYREVARTAALRNVEVNSVEARIREADGGILSSRTAALASAELQQLVNQLTSEESIEVRSNDFPPVKPLAAQYTQVPIGLQFQCRLDQLVNLVTDLAANPKYLTVRNLVIQAMNNKEKTLTVNMQIGGIMHAERK